MSASLMIRKRNLTSKSLTGTSPTSAVARQPEYQRLKDMRLQLVAQIEQLKNGGLDEQHPKLISLRTSLANDQDDLVVLRGQRVSQLEISRPASKSS